MEKVNHHVLNFKSSWRNSTAVIVLPNEDDPRLDETIILNLYDRSPAVVGKIGRAIEKIINEDNKDIEASSVVPRRGKDRHLAPSLPARGAA